MATRSSSKALAVALLVAATWVASWSFVPAPMTQQRPAGIEVASAVAGAAPLLAVQPAFADDENIPGIPYFIAFIGTIVLFLTIPAIMSGRGLK
mmetsp:Transcript_3137/g.7935  ORF Transcript_3137/g.7935 Transcript_3137/m.7935 type:complete len:94 (+) Transcript_3137:67-348(+)|eukprot:3448445-Amphidinium_carterae.1